MAGHTYRSCGACHTRLQLIGKSKETFGRPPTETERYYRCLNCNGEWLWNVQRNLFGEGIPARVRTELATR